MRSAVILLLMCLVPAPLAGQGPDDPAGRVGRRLSIVLELGKSLGGPGTGLADQLRKAGFDDTWPGGCFIYCAGPTRHPTQDGPGPALGFTARFAITGSFAVGVGYGNTNLGGSDGYRADPADPSSLFGDHVHSHWDVTMVWVGAFWKPQPGLRIGGGPGWYELENLPEEIKVSQFGVMAELGAELPADSRFFVNLALRGHLVPPKNIEYGGGDARVRLRPNWTHAQLLAGVGVRL